MDFRKELQNIEGDITATEFFMLTILSIKSKFKKEEKERITQIKFSLKKNPKDTITSSVCIGEEEIIVTEIAVPIFNSMIEDLTREFQTQKFNHKNLKDCVILLQYPAYW